MKKISDVMEKGMFIGVFTDPDIKDNEFSNCKDTFEAISMRLTSSFLFHDIPSSFLVTESDIKTLEMNLEIFDKMKTIEDLINASHIVFILCGNSKSQRYDQKIKDIEFKYNKRPFLIRGLNR